MLRAKKLAKNCTYHKRCKIVGKKKGIGRR
jgi:hypothetical protein